MTDNFVEEVIKLRNYIEENIRASKKSGIEFIDPRRFQSQIHNRQNHVIFGRRGSGKSSLLDQLMKNSEKAISINIESYKEISFPNIIVHILLRFLTDLYSISKKTSGLFAYINPRKIKLKRNIKNEINILNKLINEQDIFSEEIRRRSMNKKRNNNNLGANSEYLALSHDNERSEEKEEETKRIRISIKLDQLKNKIELYKNLINDVVPDTSSPLYLLLDDFYFIKLKDQPYLADYFHLLTKDTNLYLKIATIRHRTRLYITTDTYIGMEIGSGDTQEIDLDYTLDNFDSVKTFMTEILNSAIKTSGAKISRNDIFSGDGFNQLCIASGGVPRDFLTLLVKSMTNYIMAGEKKIGKIEATEEAIANVSNKYQSIEKDLTNDASLIDLYVSFLKMKIFTEKRTNCFLIAKDDLRSNPQGKQAINNLFDLRLVHIVDKNTSAAPSDGRRYEAYIIDVGLYDNSRPRNFNQIDPIFKDDKSRQDELRSSPRIQLDEIVDVIEKEAKEQGISSELEISEVITE